MIKSAYLYFILILLFSFLLGSRMILSGDFFFLFDQARDILLVKNIIETRDLALIGTHSGLGGFFHGPLWLYMLVPVFLLTSGNPFGLALFYVSLQFITVFVAYLVGSKLYGKKGGLIISFLIALSPSIWKAVPNTIGVNTVPLVFLGLFYFLVKYIRGDSRAFIFASFFAGLSLQFETALPLVIIPVMFIAFFINKSVYKNIRIMILSGLAFLVSISNFILFDLRNNFLMSKSLLGVLSGGDRGKNYLELGERIVSHSESLIRAYSSVSFSKGSFSILLLSAVFAYGVFLMIKNKNVKNRKEFIILLLFPVLVFGFFIFYPYQIWPDYILGLLVPVALAFYIAVDTIWKKMLGKKLVVLFFVVIFVNVFISISDQYFREYNPNNTAGSYINQKNVVEWILEDSGGGKFGYFVYTPEIFTHGMDYLISWYGKRHPDAVLESKKHGITYLIMYPHIAGDEGAHKFWKKNTIRTDGKVILSKKFKGGIVVEKLQIDENEPDVDPNYYQGLIFR